MVVVAVAGGTGGLGRTVLDAFSQAGICDVIVLSRIVCFPNIGLPDSTELNVQSRQQSPMQMSLFLVLASTMMTSKESSEFWMSTR